MKTKKPKKKWWLSMPQIQIKGVIRNGETIRFTDKTLIKPGDTILFTL